MWSSGLHVASSIQELKRITGAESDSLIIGISSWYYRYAVELSEEKLLNSAVHYATELSSKQSHSGSTL